MEWYRWDTLEAAQACLNYVNGHGKLPITGTNALTGEPAPDKQQTTKWVESVTECTDGKFGFERISSDLTAMNMKGRVPGEMRRMGRSSRSLSSRPR